MLDPPPAGPPARPEPHRHRKHPARRQGWQTALIALVAVAALAAGLAVGLSTWSANHYTATVQRVAGALPTGARPTPSGPAKAAVTFVVATVEPQQHGVEVDAVLLVRLTADQRH